jgi:hypothetical protein
MAISRMTLYRIQSHDPDKLVIATYQDPESQMFYADLWGLGGEKPEHFLSTSPVFETKEEAESAMKETLFKCWSADPSFSDEKDEELRELKELIATISPTKKEFCPTREQWTDYLVEKIMEIDEEELKEALGDEEFERLAQQGKEVIDKALKEFREQKKGERL